MEASQTIGRTLFILYYRPQIDLRLRPWFLFQYNFLGKVRQTSLGANCFTEGLLRKGANALLIRALAIRLMMQL